MARWALPRLVAGPEEVTAWRTAGVEDPASGFGPRPSRRLRADADGFDRAARSVVVADPAGNRITEISFYASGHLCVPEEATLPERLALARSRSLGHAEFLELVLADEVARRDTHSADLRARTAGLDPAMRLENWDDTPASATTAPSSTSSCPCDSSKPPTTP